MGLHEDILSLAAEFSGTKPNGTEQSDLLGAFGLDGADATEFLEAYLEQFNVDLSDLRYDFHYDANEPPHGRRLVPVGCDGNVIPCVPITLTQLVAAAEQGSWQFDYPDYTWRTARPSRLSVMIFAVSLLFFVSLYSFLQIIG